MNRPFVPQRFVIDNLLGQGLHILAGSPKVGKSWLALWLSVCIAKGEAVWGKDVKQGTTLYLCLEDSEARIQSHLYDITDEAPPCVHFCTSACVLGRGLEEQIVYFLAEHPDTVLIIIDTIQMVRNVTYDNTYATDYRDLTALKTIADENEIAILLIHHLRKEDSPDAFNRINGTTGMQGVSDTNFVLVEERRGSGQAKLYCTGRDIAYREMELLRSDENVWELIRESLDSDGITKDRITSLVTELMREREQFIATPSELAQALNALRDMSDDKVSERMVYKRLALSADRLSTLGISVQQRRSNGRRLIELARTSADGDDGMGTGAGTRKIVPVDPDVQQASDGTPNTVVINTPSFGERLSLPAPL